MHLQSWKRLGFSYTTEQRLRSEYIHYTFYYFVFEHKFVINVLHIFINLYFIIG